MKLLAIACGSAAYWIFKFILIYKLYASGDRHVLVTEEMAERRPLIICFISIFLLSISIYNEVNNEKKRIYFAILSILIVNALIYYIVAIFITIEKIFCAANQGFIIIVVAHILMLRNQRISDAFFAFIASTALIINACFSESLVSSENFEVLLSGTLSKLVVYLFEEQFKEKEIKMDNTNSVYNSFYQILDNIPSGILFCTRQGVVKANKFWFKMQKKLTHFSRKFDSDKNIHRFNKDSKEAIENENAYEMLKHFRCAKSNQLSLHDIVRNIVGKGDTLMVNPLQDFFKVFNSSFVEEQRDGFDVRDEITKDFMKNSAHLQEVTVVCNLFKPPKEYTAYIYLILQDDQQKDVSTAGKSRRNKTKYSNINKPKQIDANNVMIILNDISERIDLKASQVSEKMKTIMFCSISHELRSPLNHITGIQSLLKTKLATEEQRNLIKIAESSTEVLKIKIDDILDFYEVESGDFIIEKLQFDVRNQCKELETVFLPLMNEKRTKLLFYVNEQTPKLITHDACRIHKILVNLISNAVKYTKNGAIVVTVDWKEVESEENSSHCYIKYTVSDTGRGISKEKKQTLFKFLDPNCYKNSDLINSREPMTTSLAGTGLGISQKIANMLGTRIEYTSTVNVGSTFWFTVEITDFYVPSDIPKNRLLSVQRAKRSPLKSSRKPASSSLKRAKISKKKSYCMEDIKYDSIKSEIEKSVFIEIDTITGASNQPSMMYISEIPREIKEMSNESDSDSSVASEAFTAKNVPIFIQSAGVHDEDQRKFKRITSRKIEKICDESKNRNYQSKNDISPVNSDYDQDISPLRNSRKFEESKDNDLSLSDKNSFNQKKCSRKRTSAFNINNSTNKLSLFDGKNVSRESKKYKQRFRKFVSNADEQQIKKLDLKPQESLRPRSHSGRERRNKIKFASFIDLDNPEICNRFKKPCKCPSILIVDDQYINRFIIHQYAEKYDILCDEAEDGEEAVQMVKTLGCKQCCKGYCLVLMDLNMPIMGGIEATTKILTLKVKQEASPFLEVVAVTAFVSEKEKDKCLKVGMTDFIPKPFTISEFVRLICS